MKKFYKIPMIMLMLTLIIACMAGCGKEETEEPEVDTPDIVETTDTEEWESLEISTLYNIYFRQLNDEEKELYKKLLYHINLGEKDIEMNSNLSTKSVTNIVKAIAYDNPEIFWITGGYTLENNIITIEFNSLADDLDKNREKFNNKVKEFMDSIYFKYKIEDYEKETLIYDKLINSISYKDTELGYTSYSALIDGKASCGGYSKAFQLLMEEAGVPCYYSEGRLYNDKLTTEHAWNIIRLGDNHYNIDLTLNDTMLKDFGALSYKYYNVTDSDIKETHVKNNISLGLPVANSTELSYKAIFGKASGIGSLDTLGMDEEDVISTSEAFEEFMINWLANEGLGEHEVRIVANSSVLNGEIHYMTNLKAKVNEWFTNATERANSNWNQIYIESESYELGGDCYLIIIKSNVDYIEVPEEPEETEENGYY